MDGQWILLPSPCILPPFLLQVPSVIASCIILHNIILEHKVKERVELQYSIGEDVYTLEEQDEGEQQEEGEDQEKENEEEEEEAQEPNREFRQPILNFLATL